MKICHMTYPVDNGCSFHRHLQPARFCGPKFKEYGWELRVGAGLDNEADVLFWHGLPMDADTTTALLMAIRRPGKKFVWSVDDDWLTVPEWNPARPGAASFASYHVLKEMSHHIVCSTDHLASTFADVSHKVHVCPNLLNVSLFPPMETREDEKGTYPVMQPPRGPVRIVWSGGGTHQKDLEELTEPLDQLLSKYGGDKCVVMFNGMAPPPKIMTKHLHRGLFHQPSVPFATYQKILNSMEPHIYLAPQAPVPFNLSKSNLRVMESWALRAVPVASPWGEYNCIENGKDGRLVQDAESWYSALVRLVTDHESRIQMALRGYVRVDSQYNWNRESCRKPWDEMFATIFGITL